MDLSVTFFVVAVLAVLFAAITKSGFGNGPTFAAAPMLALVMPPAEAVALLLPLLMVIDAGSVRAYWGRWNREDARLLILAAVPGIALGGAVFHMVDPAWVKLAIGSVAIGFVAFQLSLRAGILRLDRGDVSRRAGFFWGGVLGFSSFISHAGGPPVLIYMLRRGHTKTVLQATNVLVFAAVNAMKMVVYLAIGLFSVQSIWLVLALVPVAILGTWLGVRAHHLISERLFFGLTYIFLIITGVKLVAEALA